MTEKFDCAFEEALDFLYNSMPVFHSQGASAYKPGLERVEKLDRMFGCPSKQIKCIHIAGTNGKGSTAHTIAAILQSQGYKVGLFTSPHLVDFRERMRVDGEMIRKDEVVDFVRRYRMMDSSVDPSFFELTTIMAFEFFNRRNIDYAVIETGLGGRLDSTNIITPLLSVITNISLEHTALLGDSIEKIAYEKAGIIKNEIPVVVGEVTENSRSVFAKVAQDKNSVIRFAEDESEISGVRMLPDGKLEYSTRNYGSIIGVLGGICQSKNADTILTSIDMLRRTGVEITVDSVKKGFAHVDSLTGLMGRWMRVTDSPCVICDTAHNPGGWQYVVKQLDNDSRHKFLLIGFVGDKDVKSILEMIVSLSDIDVVLTQPSVDRALDVEALSALADKVGLRYCIEPAVEDGYKKILTRSDKDDLVFVGGSTFVVSDLLKFLQK